MYVAFQIYIMWKNIMEELRQMFNYNGYWKSSSWLLKFRNTAGALNHKKAKFITYSAFFVSNNGMGKQ